jgi:arsenite methyltransferase
MSSDSSSGGGVTLNIEEAVRERYSAAAHRSEAALCCPVNYDRRYLDIIPSEIVERDYGCGDPSKHVRPGEVVLDLGSGGGKICYIAAQVVGPGGRVIGVDCNDDMLALARRHQGPIGEKLGFHNVEFHKGQIQDLRLDLERFERYLAEHPVRTSGDWLHAEEHAQSLRQTAPLVAAGTVDVVVSNCVLNLVRSDARRQLFAELFRVLKPGGRAVISDIVSSDDVPPELQKDSRLWSGCISGAFREDRFLAAFEVAGFHGVELVERQSEPWMTVGRFEFRSLTVRAVKPLAASPREMPWTVIYRGPWKNVTTDFGLTLARGERVEVTESLGEMLSQAPYREAVIALPNRLADNPQSTAPTTLVSIVGTQTPTTNCCAPASKCC